MKMKQLSRMVYVDIKLLYVYSTVRKYGIERKSRAGYRSEHE